MRAAAAAQYGDGPAAAADLLVRAHAIDSTILSEVSDYDVGGLLNRLSAVDEFEREGAPCESFVQSRVAGRAGHLSRLAFALMAARQGRRPAGSRLSDEQGTDTFAV